MGIFTQVQQTKKHHFKALVTKASTERTEQGHSLQQFILLRSKYWMHLPSTATENKGGQMKTTLTCAHSHKICLSVLSSSLRELEHQDKAEFILIQD